MATRISGRLDGLAPAQRKALERMERRRVPPQRVISPELARALSDWSRDSGRQLGALVDRRGHIRHLVVGNDQRIELPDLGRARAGHGHLRGLRLLHTHLLGEALTRDDLTDLSLLRLDLVLALQALEDGLPGQVHLAFPEPIDEGHPGEPWRLLDFPSVHDLDLDLSAELRELDARFGRLRGQRVIDTGRERAILVAVRPRRADDDRRLMELERLADTAGLTVTDRVVQVRSKPDPRTVIGRGRLQELVVDAMQRSVDLLIFDQDLSPSQVKTLANVTELKVLDRSQLILDIFAQHARSKEGRLQVELAQLRYLLPRLGIMSTAMSRLTGGIGGRGPGETKLEIRQRRARDRITRLQNDLKKVSKRRGVQRRRRTVHGLPIIAIVGYTNAGKSTLLNRMTRSSVNAADQLFATLDPTTRRLRVPSNREAVLSDTVGFIEDLPPTLLQAFKATFEEIETADLVLHVLDASSPYRWEQRRVVEEVLSELGMDGIPSLMVANKADCLDADERARWDDNRQAILVSALNGEGLSTLMQAIDAAIWGTRPDGPALPLRAAPQPEREPTDERFPKPWERGSSGDA
jgi:GTP-binding protein HflX